MLVVWGEVGRCFGGRISYSFDEFGMDAMVARFVMDELLNYGRFIKLRFQKKHSITPQHPISHTMLAFSNTAPVPTLCGKCVRMNKGVLNCGIKRRKEVQWVNCFLQPPYSFKAKC